MSDIGSVRSILKKSLKRDTRRYLNKTPHFLPLSADALKITLSHVVDTSKISIEALAQQMLASLPKSRQRLNVVEGGILRTPRGVRIYSTNIDKFTPAHVYENGEFIGVLCDSTNSFKALYNSTTKSFNKTLKQYLINEKSVYALGHTEVEGLATLPTAIKYDKTINLLTKRIEEADSSSPEYLALLGIYNSFLQSRSTFDVHTYYGNQLDIIASKEFKKASLALKINIVLIQDSEENENWGRTIESRFIRELNQAVLTLNFSNNLIEEAKEQLILTLLNKPIKNTSKKIKDSSKEEQGKKAKISNGSITKPRLRTTQGKFTSLTNLQVLLNSRLREQIKQNMGSPALNYQTGRFTNSVQVTGMSMSRQGMITAFYTYMKYPYQTFEPGYAQGSVARNPKTLISKSIREIATDLVGNRLRAVSI